MAIPISQQWEGSICTGSVIRAENKWYAWYAVRMTDRSPARLTYAVSEDLYHFHKCGDYFHIPDTYEQTGARDPKLFFHDGLYHMLVTTSLMSDGSGCLAHLVNEKMSVHGWREAACIMRWHDYCAPDSPHRSGKPECADWFQMGDFYYLVFGIGSISRYLISRMPYGPWTYPDHNTVPCGSVPKSALLPCSGRRIFMGFQGENGYAGSLRAVEALQNKNGTLRFANIGFM